MKINKKFLTFLVCPVTKTALEYDASKNELISRASKKAYPIRNGVPILLINEARDLDCVEKTKTRS